MAEENIMELLKELINLMKNQDLIMTLGLISNSLKSLSLSFSISLVTMGLAAGSLMGMSILIPMVLSGQSKRQTKQHEELMAILVAQDKKLKQNEEKFRQEDEGAVI